MSIMYTSAPVTPRSLAQIMYPSAPATPRSLAHPPHVQAPQGQYTTGVPLQYFPPQAKWSTGLCRCCSDGPDCCLTCVCPCITFGQIAEIVGKGSTSCASQGALYALICLLSGCGCLYSCTYRTKMRRQYMLPESPCNDCFVHWCCEPCALCQEYRELKNRGFDMSLGWEGNEERLNHGVVTQPVVPGVMER